MYAFVLVVVSVALCATLISLSYKVNEFETNEVVEKLERRMHGQGALRKAISLTAPIPTKRVGGEMEGVEFYDIHGDLLRSAWKEFEATRPEHFKHKYVDAIGDSGTHSTHSLFYEDMVADDVQQVLNTVRSSPTAESEALVRSLFTEEAPGVFSARLLKPEGIAMLRNELDAAHNSGIPTRRPNGMNRYGVIIDKDINGAVSYLEPVISQLVKEIVRPVGRMLFPEAIGAEDDIEMFAFTVKYELGEDVKLTEHRDASVVTLNMNLKPPGDDFGGSSLYFVDEVTGEHHLVNFEPGVALIHKGSLRHAANPIVSGEGRENLIVWLFGEHGDVRTLEYPQQDHLTVQQRWKGAP